MNDKMLNDALIDAMIASPDDDAPRLVWADREGGERGELVVLQCALAKNKPNEAKRSEAFESAEGRGDVLRQTRKKKQKDRHEHDDLTADDRRRMIRREQELLKKHGDAWAKTVLNNIADPYHPTFVRGFIEKVAISGAGLAQHATELFDRAPLVRELYLGMQLESVNRYAGPTGDEVWAIAAAELSRGLAALPPDRITALRGSAFIFETGDWADSGYTFHFGDALVEVITSAPESIRASIRSIDIPGSSVTEASVPHLALLTSLESLTISSHSIDGARCAELLRALPKLRRLAMKGGNPPLNGSHLQAILDTLDACDALGGGFAPLESLDLLGNYLGSADVERIARTASLANLERLVIGEHRDYLVNVEAIATSPLLTNLRALHLAGPLAANSLDAIASASFAPHLRELTIFSRTLPPADRLLSMFPSLEYLNLSGVAPADTDIRALEAVIPDVRK